MKTIILALVALLLIIACVVIAILTTTTSINIAWLAPYFGFSVVGVLALMGILSFIDFFKSTKK